MKPVSLVPMTIAGKTRVFLDDLDITQALRGYTVQADPNEPIRCTLELFVTFEPDEMVAMAIADKIIAEKK